MILQSLLLQALPRSSYAQQSASHPTPSYPSTSHPESPPSATATPSTPRPLPELCKSTRRLATDVRNAYGTANYPQLVRELVEAYREVSAHPDQQHVATMKLKKDVAILLSRISADIERQLASSPAPPARISHPLGALAQQLGPVPGAGVAAPGGVPAGFAPAGVIGNGVADYGQDLVDLIHAVIQPDIWDVNGGPASVVYYRPLQVLVVRAPGEVHDQIGGALNGLRRP
jgi:hypothetical protein